MQRTFISSAFFLLLILPPTVVLHAQGPYNRRTPIVEAFEKNKDAVVNISSQYKVVLEKRRSFFYEFWTMEDWLDDSLLGPNRRKFTLSSLGSGFVLDPRGYIVTNAHVVNQATDITVIMANGQKHQAKIIESDQADDLAVLKIDVDHPLTAVTLGTSEDLMIGETALAIGNPLGYQHTLTDGVISAIHRQIEVAEGFVLADLIQISAPINPGSSGGPLLNINGQLIGINTAISKDAQGIGFAIPVDRFRQNLPKMLQIDSVKRIDFGAEVTDIDQNILPASKNPPNEGAMILSVKENSAAKKAGLRPGDIITTVNKRHVLTAIDFSLTMLELEENATVHFEIWRNSPTRLSPASVIRISLKLRARPKPEGAALAWKLFGLNLARMTKTMINRYEIAAKLGDIAVLSVEEASPADRAGIEPGDILIAINGDSFKDLDELGLKLETIKPATRARITIKRTRSRAWHIKVAIYEFTLKARPQKNTTPPPNHINI